MNNKDLTNELSTVRGEIDSLDKEIASLIGKRIKAVAKVAEIKKESGKAVLDTSREAIVLENAVKNSGMTDFQGGVRHIFKDIMNTSRLYQYTALNEDDAEAESSIKENPTVAIQGVKGAFAHEAAQKMFPDGNIVFCETKAELAQKLKNNEVDLAVLPVENSKAGSVNDVYDLIMSEKLCIVKAIKLSVSHCLACVDNNDAYLEGITEVYSHMQAIDQSRKHLETLLPNARLIPMYNTAAAARMVAGLEDPKRAAICSAEAAKLYGLKILAENIQDEENNTTRFIALSKDRISTANANKISLVFTLPHSEGSLSMVLSSFASLGLNLTKIESRAVNNSLFEYRFYLDFEGSVLTKEVNGLLNMLEKELSYFFFLGNYEEL